MSPHKSSELAQAIALLLPYARRAVAIYTYLGSPGLREAQETLQDCLAGAE